LDAAIRLGGRSSGAWLLTLPASLMLCVGLIVFLEAAEKGASTGAAVWILGLAWCLRGLGQGAAGHHLEQQLLSSEPAPLGASIRAAIRRAPSLLFTATVLGPLSLVRNVLTLGLGLLMWRSTQVAYAVAMHRRGPLHLLWREASLALGPSGALAGRIRWFLPFQALLLINLHVAVRFALSLARSLFGLDVAQLSRLTSLDNPGWWMLLGVVTLAVMEPIRAAIAVLLLLDARVRREGMDLHARLQALPSPRRLARGQRPASKVAAAGKLVWVIGLVSLSLPAQARTPLERTRQTQVARLEALMVRCSGRHLEPSTRDALAQWEARGSATLTRWLDRQERVVERQGCAQALPALQRDLSALSTPAPPEPPHQDVASTVKEILSRPEFEVLPPQVQAQEAPGTSSFWTWLEKLLEAWFGHDDAPRERSVDRAPRPSFGSGLGLSQLLIWVLPVIALGVAIRVLGRHLSARAMRGAPPAPGRDIALDAPPAEAAPTALSRPPATWLQLADGLAAAGRHREAIRSAYLATLAGLHHQGRIRYDPHHSNWDHLMGFRGDGSARAIFRELTHRFDGAWYGEGNVDVATWQRVRGHAVHLIGPELQLEAAGA